MSSQQEFDPPEIRATVLDVLHTIAPELDVAGIRDDAPLRQQVDLDSMDWLNVLAGIEQRLQVKIPEAEYLHLSTLAAIVACVGTLPAATASSPAPAPTTTGYPAELVRRHWLFDGREVLVRPIRADDATMEADFVRHLSSDSRYRRFMGTLKELPPGKLRCLTEIDYKQHLALVATVRQDAGELEIGVARYVVTPDSDSCEFAIVVDDDWQGSGVAGTLMADLIEAARARGLAEMEGIVLASNHEMIRFARQLGFDVHRDPDDHDCVRVRRRL